jgi:muramidase (phage lysozyme)
MVSRVVLLLVLAIGIAMGAAPAAAERQSLFPLGATRTSAVLPGVTVRRGVSESASLFTGTSGSSLFAPLASRSHTSLAPLAGNSPAARLLSLIALAEAGPAGYDAVQYGATIRPSGRPTDLTLGEIFAWIDATPGQPHAIGRYQFIPSTLRELVTQKGLGRDVRFSPTVQDQLALVLLHNAGLPAFQAGQMDRETFMRNLARIWAGLPLPSGRSYYEGYAGNSAAMSWTDFESGIVQIFPTSG